MARSRLGALFQDFLQRWMDVQAVKSGRRPEARSRGFVMICGTCAERKAQVEMELGPKAERA